MEATDRRGRSGSKSFNNNNNKNNNNTGFSISRKLNAAMKALGILFEIFNFLFYYYYYNYY
jgi:hypothetical protein